jgi:chromosome partitioning protein
LQFEFLLTVALNSGSILTKVTIMKSIAIANQKGGVGKTTTAINLGYCLALANKKTLVVDLDPQANATSGLGITSDKFHGTYQILLEGTIDPNSIKKTSFNDNLSVVPSASILASLEYKLDKGPLGKQKLKNILLTLNNTYDFALIDCPPSFGNISNNALNAANSVIIPIQCEYFAMEGLSQTIKTINTIKSESNPTLFLAGILLTMYNKALQYNREVAIEIRRHFSNKVFKTIIQRDVTISEASSFAKPVFEYDITSLGTSSYVEFTREFLGYYK